MDSTTPMDLTEVLAPSRDLGARWSVDVRRDGESTPFIEHGPSDLLRTASIAKIFVLIDLAGRLISGEILAEQLVDRRDTRPVLDSGIWHALRVDRLPVIDLAVLVGAMSDNWATNALIDVCGLDRVRELAAALAPGGSMLHDYVRDQRSGADPATLSEGCAADWATIMQRLYRADGIDADVCRQVLGWLAQDTDLSLVAAAFDLDPLAHDTEDLGLRLWHKTGTDTGVRADVGLLRSAGAVVSYAVVCNWPTTDASPHTRRLIHSTMRRIGERISSAVTPTAQKSSSNPTDPVTPTW